MKHTVSPAYKTNYWNQYDISSFCSDIYSIISSRWLNVLVHLITMAAVTGSQLHSA